MLTPIHITGQLACVHADSHWSCNRLTNLRKINRPQQLFFVTTYRFISSQSRTVVLGYRPFRKARKLVTSLKLTDQSQFQSWAVSAKRPIDIPYNPEKFYSDKWVSWEHFLGAETELRDGAVASSPSGSAVSTKATPSPTSRDRAVSTKATSSPTSRDRAVSTKANSSPASRDKARADVKKSVGVFVLLRLFALLSLPLLHAYTYTRQKQPKRDLVKRSLPSSMPLCSITYHIRTQASKQPKKRTKNAASQASDQPKKLLKKSASLRVGEFAQPKERIKKQNIRRSKTQRVRSKTQQVEEKNADADDSDNKPAPEAEILPQKIQLVVQLPPQCTVLEPPASKNRGDNPHKGESNISAELLGLEPGTAPVDNKKVNHPDITACMDGSGLCISLLENTMVHELQLLISQSTSGVPLPFDLWHAPAVRDLDITISPKHCTERTFRMVDEVLAPILLKECPDVIVRLHGHHRLVLRKPVAFASDKLKSRSKNILEQVAMALQQLNRVLNQHGCPNAVVQMEYFVECADTRDKKRKLRTAEACMKTIQDFIKNVGANGLVEWAYVNLTLQ